MPYSLNPARHKRKSILVLAITCFGLWQTAYGQTMSITGATCGIIGTQYTYTIAGPWNNSTNMVWSVSGNGTISGSSSGTPLPHITVTWNSGTSGTVSVTTTTPTSNPSLSVTIGPTLLSGTISNPSQSLNSGSVPATINCPLATGGACGTTTYAYQWQQSTDNVTFTNITGATSQNLSFTTGLTQTMYYQRMVTLSPSGTIAYSTVATVTIYPVLVPGSVTPASQSINYGHNASVLTSTGVSGGNNSYSYVWQSSYDAINWTNTGGGSNTYTPTALLVTTYFRVVVSSNGVNGNSSSALVTVGPQLFPGSITPSSITIASGTSPGEISATGASGGGCSGSYTYQWQNSTDGVNFSAISGATSASYIPGNLTTTTWYRRQVTCSTDVLYTNSCKVTIGIANTDLNFIRARDITKPGVTDPVTAAGLTSTFDVTQETEYFDGLGRLNQTVAWQETPLGKDLVTPTVYDALGRESTKYLPYVASTTDGNYKATAVQDQYTFNSAQFSGEQNYYGQVVFEPSPLNRPQITYAPGLNWVGSGRGATSQYLVNQVSDSVRYWTIASAAGSIPVTATTYATGTLNKNQTTDEANHSVVEYKDVQGKVVLKKVQLAASPGTAHVGWLSTYYVYDSLNNLRFVIQPRAIDLLQANATWNLSTLTSLTDELCFRYEYDYRKRMIIKKNPGAGEVWMVYDGRDRLAMIQDANLRTAGKWHVTKYDGENRPDSAGLLTDANNRAYHQNLSEHSISYPSTISNFELLSQTFYDDYLWAAGQGVSSALITNYTGNATYFNTSYNTSPVYAQQIAQYLVARGMVTGSQSKVIGTTSQYLTAVSFYDDHGRMIESQSLNQTGAMDTVINQYDFTGKIIRNLIRHTKSGTNSQNHSVLSKLNYDAGERLLTIYKNIDNATSDQLISTNRYDELGQLQNKTLGNNLDSLAYAYNIRGWLNTINKNFISGTPGNYFGMELGYDKTTSVAGTTSYNAAQYNGNITGTVWKSAGDGVGRKYDFTYDNVNRLTAANFVQNTSGSAWDASYIDFTASNLTYDGNGNILTMNQKGFTVGGSSLIDQLTYSYQANTNKLTQVNDAQNNPTSKLGDFHYSGTKQLTDYSYDANGNLILDNNKAISAIGYNYLNLPQSVAVSSKGTITYTYDAAGTKLYKTTVDSTVTPVKTSLTTYIGGFVYQATSPPTGGPVAADTLQFISHEEGRVRWAYHKYSTGTVAYGFEYDFFEKDHLGNTRVVLTQQKDTTGYLASGEAIYRATESQLFSNLTTTAVARTTAAGYPDDLTYTNPNDTVFKVNGTVGGHKMGPSLLLKVMSGDKIDLGVQSYYNSGTVNTPNTSLTDVLASLATGVVNMTSGGKGSITDLNNTTTSPIYAALNSFLPTDDPTPPSKPKAYLNWILLDDQLKYVSSYPQSGAIGVGAAGTLTNLACTGIPITKNGFLYIWVSNETPSWDVFFDNLSVKQYSGPLLEETHYYPFGLTMAGISSKALKTNYAENKHKYNKGSELQNKEFSDGSGLEMYETNLRELDPQLGRWWQIDPKSDYAESPYAAMGNNPIRSNDPLGDSINNPRDQAIAARIERNIKGQINRNNQAVTKSQNKIANNNSKISKLKSNIASGNLKPRDVKSANKEISKLDKANGKENSNITEKQEQNSQLNESLQDINNLRSDENYNYTFGGAPAGGSGEHGVLRGRGNNVIIQGSNDGLYVHEIRHIQQSLDNGGLRFSSNPNTMGRLLNAGSNPTQRTAFEVDAYQAQFSLDHSYPAPGGARVLADINATSLHTINGDNDTPLY